MAEGNADCVGCEEDNTVDNSVFQFGVGRGLFRQTLDTRTPGPGVRAIDIPVLTSTPYAENPTAGQHCQIEQNTDLGSLITQLADKIGQSIVDKIQSDGSSQFNNKPPQALDMSLSNVRLVMQPDVKEPPVYRGDGSDKFTVHEWEDLMTLYLKKRAIPLHEHSQEIISRLMGKAGDVVKIKLRNDKSINHIQNPLVIFDILKQHFSELNYSNMPLADFYNTLPMPDEDAVEYWIRLNKMMDVVCECLQRQGRNIDDPSHEVTLMFIKHCPDKSLASVFKFKSAEKWSASEVQERLDEHSQEKKARAVIAPTRHKTEYRSHTQSCVPGAGEVPVSHCTAHLVSSPVPAAQSSLDNDSLRSLVNLLDRLVSQQAQAPVAPPSRPGNSQHSHRVCAVCGTPAHSTLSHCRRENRCLKCLSPGHWKRNCPQISSQRPVDPNGGSATPGQQLN